jgi:hypothetical protein
MATKEELLERMARIDELFSSIAVHADEQATWRCPYKNRFDRCTAQFGCRNQRKPEVAGELKHCAGDDKLDYRPAWESPGE